MVLPTTNKKKSPKGWNPLNIILGFGTCIFFILFVAIFNINQERSSTFSESTTATSMAHQDENKQWYEKSKPLITEFPIPSKRNDIIPMLEKLRWKTAVEVGVQKGLFAKKMLDNWPSCTEYKLVDLWGQEEGYQEPGNHSRDFHDRALGQTRRRVKQYSDKVEFFIMRSTDASKHLQDNHFDFIYLDARHDYCAVAEDIAHYWPKVRPGGILAGHDYIDAQYALDRLGEAENWGICEDGTKQPRAVRGAVEDFMKAQKIDFVLVSQEDFPSWFIQKPYAD